jgi:predicted RNase H-like nuclease (RuvC/YqgF family)
MLKKEQVEKDATIEKQGLEIRKLRAAVEARDTRIAALEAQVDLMQAKQDQGMTN